MLEGIKNIISGSASKSMQRDAAHALAEHSVNTVTPQRGYFAILHPKVKSIIVQGCVALLSAIVLALVNKATAGLLLALTNPIGAYIILAIVAIGVTYILWRTIVEPLIKYSKAKKAARATFAEFKDRLNVRLKTLDKDIYNNLKSVVESEYKIDIKQLDKEPSAEYKSKLIRRFKNALALVNDPQLKSQLAALDVDKAISPSLKFINISKMEKASPEMKAAKYYNQLLATTHSETPIWLRLEIKSAAVDNYIKAEYISKLLKASRDMESVDEKIAQAEKVIEALFPNDGNFRNSRALLVLFSENIADTVDTNHTLRSFDPEDDEMEIELLEFIGENLALVPNTTDDVLRMLAQALDIQQLNSINIQHSPNIEASTLLTPPPSPTNASLPAPKPTLTDGLGKSKTNAKPNFIFSNDRES